MATVPVLRRQLAKMRIEHRKEEQRLVKKIQAQYNQEFFEHLRRA